MSDNLQQELKKFELSTREGVPWVRGTVTVLAVLLSLLHLWFNTLSTWSELWIQPRTLRALLSSVLCGIPPIHV